MALRHGVPEVCPYTRARRLCMWLAVVTHTSCFLGSRSLPQHAIGATTDSDRPAVRAHLRTRSHPCHPPPTSMRPSPQEAPHLRLRRARGNTGAQWGGAHGGRPQGGSPWRWGPCNKRASRPPPPPDLGETPRARRLSCGRLRRMPPARALVPALSLTVSVGCWLLHQERDSQGGIGFAHAPAHHALSTTQCARRTLHSLRHVLTTPPQVYMAHELGHNLGLTHAGSLVCRVEGGSLARAAGACRPDW